MVSRKTVAKLMRAAGLDGIPRRQTRKNPEIEVRSEDLVNRDFLRTQPDLLWVCDITEHPTREGKLYCCAVLDAFSRKSWAGPSTTTRTSTSSSTPSRWRSATVSPSLAPFSTPITACNGTVGDGYDNAMMESFWSKLQTELLDRKKWKTRTELANEIGQYLEIFHDRQRRHSKLGYLTPVEYERLHELQQPA